MKIDNGNKLVDGAKTYGQIGGILAALVMAIWPHINPASVMDQGVVDASVRVAMLEAVEASEKKIDAKLDKEVRGLRESISDKITALKEAVLGLKDLTVERIKTTEKDFGLLRSSIGELKDSLKRSRTGAKELEKKVQEIEKQLAILQILMDSPVDSDSVAFVEEMLPEI